MYLNQTEKFYKIYSESLGWYNGTKFTKDPFVVAFDIPAYPKKKADDMMFALYRGLPYELVHNGNQIILGKFDNWCAVDQVNQEWREVEVELQYAPGYRILPFGTEEIVIQISTKSVHNYYDVHVAGNKIVKVIQYFFGEKTEVDTLMFEIDNPVGKFFKLTDRKANLSARINKEA
uniref:Uncharacterized protein n=1 Tax=Pseudomonas phage RVTF4 TaxID=3236931 RepID=A0AB39CD31_9VIRU